MNRSDSDCDRCETCASLMLENSRLKHENEMLLNKKSAMPLLRSVGGVIWAVAYSPFKLVSWVWGNLLPCLLIGTAILGISYSIYDNVVIPSRLASEAAAKPFLTLREMAKLDGRMVRLYNTENVVKIDGGYYHLSPGDYNHCLDDKCKFSIKKILDYRDTLARLEELTSRYEKPVEEKK